MNYCTNSERFYVSCTGYQRYTNSIILLKSLHQVVIYADDIELLPDGYTLNNHSFALETFYDTEVLSVSPTGGYTLALRTINSFNGHHGRLLPIAQNPTNFYGSVI
ncbi:MAG: hypothetical protein J7L96_09330 [Bacteroidales bacterium]|nr:hypothetical protein [Bacteroidales bacterium]